jgi:rfaE bifunctional protein kinase chain/domain
MDFSKLKVLVLGDICLDITEEGPSYRQSPEAPVPVILNPSTTYSLGMAGNVALNLKSLGVDLDFIFSFGEDENGYTLLELIENNFGEDVRIARYDGSMRTITKKRIIANNQQLARIDFEDIISQKDMEEQINLLKGKLERGIKYDLIIISDYNKGVISKESWSIIRPLLEQLSNKFFVDTKKKNVLDFYEGMYLFPNTKEMNEIMEYNNCKTRNDLRKELDLDFIIETASDNGAFLYKDDGKIYHCPPFKSNVVDVTGCGDTFVAAFTLYYTKYNDKKAALGFANYCCSKVIERKGTTPVLISEVRDFHDIKGV